MNGNRIQFLKTAKFKICQKTQKSNLNQNISETKSFDCNQKYMSYYFQKAIRPLGHSHIVSHLFFCLELNKYNSSQISARWSQFKVFHFKFKTHSKSFNQNYRTFLFPLCIFSLQNTGALWFFKYNYRKKWFYIGHSRQLPAVCISNAHYIWFIRSIE